MPVCPTFHAFIMQAGVSPPLVSGDRLSLLYTWCCPSSFPGILSYSLAGRAPLFLWLHCTSLFFARGYIVFCCVALTGWLFGFQPFWSCLEHLFSCVCFCPMRRCLQILETVPSSLPGSVLSESSTADWETQELLLGRSEQINMYRLFFKAPNAKKYMFLMEIKS